MVVNEYSFGCIHDLSIVFALSTLDVIQGFVGFVK